MNFPALSAAYATLTHSSPEADANAMLTTAQALADVQTAELTSPTTVGVLFKDGTTAVIDMLPLNGPDNTLSSADYLSSAPRASRRVLSQARPSEVALPSGRMAFLSDAVPENYQGLHLSSPPIDDLATWLRSVGYQVTSSAGDPYDLSQLTNVSVMVMNHHGGVGILSSHYASDTTGTKTFTIATGFLANSANINVYLPQIQQEEMGYYLTSTYFADTATGNVKWDMGIYLFITPKFVRDYMTFSPDSLLWMNVCDLMSSAEPTAQDMVQAFFDKGAGAMFGWNAAAGAAFAVDSGWFFFDRVLGTGAYAPYQASPPNRPFNIESVFAEMHGTAHQPVLDGFVGSFANVPLDTSYLSEQKYDPASRTVVATGNVIKATLVRKYSQTNLTNNQTIALVPSISTLSLENNNKKLTVTGDFGGLATNRSISIGGTDYAASWGSGAATVSNLPLTAGGPVIVKVDGVQSNPVLINQWNNVPLTMTTHNGDVTRTVTCTVNLRGSFDVLRQSPDKAPAVNSGVIVSGVTTDDYVLQNGTCSFVSNMPAGGDSIPWVDTTQGGFIPATGANAVSVGSNTDGNGGGTVGISIQAAYSGGQFGFLDTSATNASQLLTFDDTSGSLLAGSADQSFDTLQWGATAATFQPQFAVRPHTVKSNRR